MRKLSSGLDPGRTIHEQKRNALREFGAPLQRSRHIYRSKKEFLDLLGSDMDSILKEFTGRKELSEFYLMLYADLRVRIS
ncbi:hypothetical protein GGP41_007875 [Bipolaris sorokiniana]|uniref:Uncharacterized protein n=1 Tax=Cochliobolus sativus TaxID=45130 RepID=A0A8H5ZN33_COCSA|nr:hypothetical protein GGP41_007875 [Bipolaris sorokiniana]